MSSSEAPFVSIITVNYNGKRFLESFFGALERLDYPKDRRELLFVDNGSSDGSVALVRARWPWAKIVESDCNLGFAAGNNLGIRHAQGEFIALLNNDTEVAPGWLRELVAVLARDGNLGSATSKILFLAKRGEINNVGLNLYRDGSGGDRGFHQPDDGRFDAEAEVFGGCGASVLLRRSMLDDVGLFDETFFMYYEDLDLAWRARLRGWDCRYAPKSVVYHVHCGSSGEWSPFFTFHVERNKIFANLKNNGWLTVLLALAMMALRTADKARLLARRRPDAWAFLRAYLKAWASLARHAPAMLVKRLRIRVLRRKVPDRAIARFIVPNP